MARTSTGRRAQGPERTPVRPARTPARAPRAEPDLWPSEEETRELGEAARVTPFPRTFAQATPDADAEAVQARAYPSGFPFVEHVAVTAVDVSPEKVQQAHEGYIKKLNEPVFEPPQASTTVRVSLDTILVEDVDRLWDWYRADADARALFEQHFATSPELHQAIAVLGLRERQGQVWMRAVCLTGEDRAHCGFVLLGPIMQGAVAAFRLYLAPTVRAGFNALFPAILAALDRALPTVTLSLVAPDQATSEAMQQHGFEAQTILTRTPRPTPSEA